MPVHLSIVWIPVPHPNPVYAGSLGAGLLLEPGVVVQACPGEGLEPTLAFVRRALVQLGWRNDATFRIKTMPELGVGLGVSGALALAHALAYGALHGISSTEAARAAHIAEVLESTGLGDVVAEYYGRGLVIRESPGAPGVSIVSSYPLDSRLSIVVVRFNGVDTRVLIERGAMLAAEALRAYRMVYEEPNLETLLEAARMFTHRVTPPPKEAKRLVEECGRLALGWVFKKRVLAFPVEPQNLSDLVACIADAGYKPRVLRVSQRGWGTSLVSAV